MGWFGNLLGGSQKEDSQAPSPAPRHAQRVHHTEISIEGVDVLAQYTTAAGRVSITITKDGRYLVNEPPFSKEAERDFNRIIDKMRESVELDIEDKTPEEIERIVYNEFMTIGKKIFPVRNLAGVFHSLGYYLARDLTGFGILHPMMTDPDIEDIKASAPNRPIFIDHKKYSNQFESLVSNVAFPSDEEMIKFINRSFRPTGNEPTVAKPGAVTYMWDKSRISATYGNVISDPGSTIAIRKFPKDPYVITHMMKGNTITPRMAAFLWSLIDAQGAGLIIGTTGSGKTTFLGALTTMMHPRWRVLTMEDALELNIPHLDWVRYRVKKTTGTVGAEHDVTIAKLIDQSLTQKPNYEIVGEIRNVADASDLFQSMGTGHGGLCLPPGEMLPVRRGSTISYDSIRNVVERYRDGEELYAYALEGGRGCWRRITGTVVKDGPDDWRRITAGGATATVHAGHPVITNLGVVDAKEVKPGDAVPVILGLQRDVATHIGHDGDHNKIRLNAASGRLLAAEQAADLRHFALTGPEAFVRACGVIPKRYHPVSDRFAWEAVESVERPSLGKALYDIQVRSAHNFAHGDGIVTHNTTFHANTPQGALTRMRLGGVTDADLTLLSFIVYITQIRVDGVKKRRVRNITEVTSGPDGRPQLKDLFTYVLKNDKFVEVKDLLKTQQYQEACFRNSVHDPDADMARREELLRECITKEANDVKSVFGILGRYYGQR